MDAKLQITARIAIALAFLLRGFTQGSWYPRIPGVMDGASVQQSHLGFIFFLYALGNILAFTLSANVIGRIGTARTHAVFALPFPLFAIALSAAPATMHVATGMFAFGLFTGGYDLSTSVQGAVVERQTRIPFISTLYGLFSVGALLGAFSSGQLATAGVSIPIQFGAIALVSVPASIWATRQMLPDDLSRVPGARRRRMPTLPPKVLLPLGLTIVCIAMGEETINNWVAMYMKEELHVSSAIAAMGYTAFSVATALGRLLGDTVIRFVGVDKVLIIGSTVAALGMGGGVLMNTPWSIIGGYTLVGLGLSVVVPVTYRRANQIPGIAPAQAVATVASIGFAGFLIGPLVIGAIANIAGLQIAFVVVSGILLGIAILTRLNPSPSAAIAGSIDRNEGAVS